MIHLPYDAPIGIGLMITGIAIRYKIGQRRFKRRSITGLEFFPSYTKALLTRFIEGLAGMIAKIFIFAGIFLILAASL